MIHCVAVWGLCSWFVIGAWVPMLPACGSVPGDEGDAGIPYRVVDQWTIPAGGTGKVIVVDSLHVNELDLRSLGNQLRREAKRDRHAQVYVFDDVGAAVARRQAEEALLAQRPRSFLIDPPGGRTRMSLDEYQSHRVGEYTKNTHTGYDSFWMFPDGYDGEIVEIPYPSR